MTTDIQIAEKRLLAVAELLSVVMAGEVTLYTKTRKFHCNVSGGNFTALHKLFEEQYRQLEKSIDEVADRINKLGSRAISNMVELVKLSPVKEYPGEYPSLIEMKEELFTDHEIIICCLNKSFDSCTEKYHHTGSANFLKCLIDDHQTIVVKLKTYFN